jgi:hypothetical protein
MRKRGLTLLLSLFLSAGLLSSCMSKKLPMTSVDVLPSPTTAQSVAIDQTSSPIVVSSWQDTYARFLRENIQKNKVNVGSLADGSVEQERFSSFLAGGYPVTPFFYLYDIDKDGIPELICVNAVNGDDADLYSYKNKSISKLGSVKFYPFGGLGILADKTEGLYSDIGYKEKHGEIYVYTINCGILTEKKFLEYNNQSELSPSQNSLSYSFDNFDMLDYYETTEANITKVIYGGEYKH